MAKTREQRFWGKVDKSDTCWNWTGALKGRGPNCYPSFDGKVGTRVLWQMTHGSIPVGMLVMHSCDNPKCVRPDHLKLGTPKDNTQDAVRKNRMSRIARGASAVNLAKTHCKRGHELSGENLYTVRNERVCRTCANERYRRYYGRKHGADPR